MGCFLFALQIIQRGTHSCDYKSGECAFFSLNGFFHLLHHIIRKTNRFVCGWRCCWNFEFPHSIDLAIHLYCYNLMILHHKNMHCICNAYLIYCYWGDPMSELCLDCYNAITQENHTKKEFLMTRKPDFCEECGQWKPVIIRVRTRYLIKEWFDALSENIRYYRQSSK